GKPGMKSDETDDNSTERGQRSHASENSHQRGVAGLTLELVFRPADLPIDVGTDGATQRTEHQPRPRDIIPTMTPTSSAPAIVPRGLRRAILSSSDAKVLACSLAAEASSDPASVTPLVALPTCEAAAWLMLRAVLPPRRRPVMRAARMYPSGLPRPGADCSFLRSNHLARHVRVQPDRWWDGTSVQMLGWNSCASSFLGVQNCVSVLRH